MFVSGLNLGSELRRSTSFDIGIYYYSGTYIVCNNVNSD